MQVGGRSHGREGAHRRLLARLTQPREGFQGGGVVLVVGTVGIGKTTFVERLRAAAEAGGVCCGSAGWGSELSAGPLEPWLHALEDLDDGRRRAGVPEPLDRTEVTSASLSPLARYREFARLLEGASTDRPCLVVLEDLHDADSASVDLLKGWCDSTSAISTERRTRCVAASPSPNACTHRQGGAWPPRAGRGASTHRPRRRCRRARDDRPPDRTRDRDGRRVPRAGTDPSPSRLGDLAGLAMIGHLVTRPGSDWHVLDLYGGANRVPGVHQSDAGPMIDETARRAYQERYATLSAERQRAEDDHDLVRAELLGGELDALETELVAAFGLGGAADASTTPANAPG